MSTLTTRQQADRAERDAKALAVIQAAGGRDLTCQEVATASGLSVMESYWALRRLVIAGQAANGVRPVGLKGREGELTAMFRAAPEDSSATVYPSWLCGTLPPAPTGRRVVIGSAGLLAYAPHEKKAKDE